MKKKSAGIRIAFVICAALGWWGVLYPQLAMTPDTYRVVSEDGTVQTDEFMVKWDFDNDIYREILNADRGRIKFKSKLFETAARYLEQLE